MNQNRILIFGGGKLQQYLINTAKKKGLFTIVIDPDKNAYCKDKADVFRVVGGQDYDATLSVAKEFEVKGVITSATDKPLVMMARVAEQLSLPCCSVSAAIASTDKLAMKKVFLENSVPCAAGVEIVDSIDYKGDFPVIVKPRDNSGSRGVFFCRSFKELESVVSEVSRHTKKNTILVEEYIAGQEYSIESLHWHGKTKVVQITKKTTSALPYNVELEHCQPAHLPSEVKLEVEKIISKIGDAFNFANCASHTEMKITPTGDIKVIETSPRLGGDYITSHLVPLSTGISMESLLLDIVTNELTEIPKMDSKVAKVIFFTFQPGKKCGEIGSRLHVLESLKGVVDIEFNLSPFDTFPVIKNSLDRYGHVILQANSEDEMLELSSNVQMFLKKCHEGR